MPSKHYALGVCLLIIGTASAQQNKTYTVQRGDTLKTISKHFHVPVAELISENSLSSSRIKAGMRLHIPESTANKYTVRQGDNDWVIGHRLGIAPSALRDLNPDVNWKALQIGEKLNVPANVVAAQEIKAHYVVVSANHAIVRSGPDRSDDKVDQVDSGVKGEILGSKSGWYKLKLDNGTTGWIRGDLVSVQPAQSAPAAEAPTKAVAVKVQKTSKTHKSGTGSKAKAPSSKQPPVTKIPPVTKQSTSTPPALAKTETSPASEPSQSASVPPVLRALVLSQPASQAPTATVAETRSPDLGTCQPVADGVFAGSLTPLVAAETSKMFSPIEPGKEWQVDSPADEKVAAAEEDPEPKKAVSRHTRHRRSRLARAGNSYHVPGHDVSAEELLRKAYQLRGTRYRYGGLSLSGLDCSGFTTTVFRSEGIQLPRTSRSQSQIGEYVNKSSLKPGDLLFFRTGRSSRINHVGIYVGNGKFIHAASGYGAVRVDNLKGHYNHELATARRIPVVRGHSGSAPKDKKNQETSQPDTTADLKNKEQE